jgi:type II secretory pathway predicted ATPase ExeA
MNTSVKNKIKASIEIAVERGTPGAQIARMAGINAAYISLIRNNNEGDTIKPEHYNAIARALNVRVDGWQTVETRNLRIVTQVLNDARHNSLFMAVAHNAGAGKSVACREYIAANPAKAVYFYQVEHQKTNKADFMRGLIKSLGIETRGKGYMSSNRMADEVIQFFTRRLDQYPLLIIDQANDLTANALSFFISLYNAVQGRMGCVMLGTENLEQTIKRGVSVNRMGFDELDSRFGRKYIKLMGVDKAECRDICKANGIADENLSDALFRECEPATNERGQQVLRDLRPLERKIQRELLRLKKQEGHAAASEANAA